jgi:hypothetical protein
MLNISVIDVSSHRRPVREGESVSRPRLPTEAEATKQLDRIAPDWPLHLYDGVVIDHILKVVNQARTPRTEITRRYRARRAASNLAEDEARPNAPQRAIQSHPSDSAAITEKAGERLQDRSLAREGSYRRP